MKKVYIWTIIISVAFIVPACFITCPVLSIISSIGCSGIAAAMMAIFLDKVSKENQDAVKRKAKKFYFNELHEQLKMMLERIVWFDDRMGDDSFDWGLNPTEYSSLRYMIWSSDNYKNYDLSNEEIENRLSLIASKYGLEHQKELSDDEKQNMNRMFCILATSGIEIIRQINIIEKNKLLLDSEDYMSLEDIKSLYFSISIAIGMMNAKNKNYGLAITQLLSAYHTTSDLCGDEHSFTIGLHGSISMDEL